MKSYFVVSRLDLEMGKGDPVIFSKLSRDFKFYSRDIVMDFVIAGSKQDVIKRIEEYIEAGVDHFFLRDFSPDKQKSFDIISKEIMPYFRK